MSKLTDKSYGVARKDGDFSFVGFAKKAKSDEAQKVDIYLDKELIDTINSDEYNQEIDDLYGADNLAFSYHLPFRYIDGKSHNLTFKVHGTDEQLRGSPLSVMEKSHKNFNEARFMRSLDEPLSEELKDMYKPNSIGFLATKENMEDEEFVGYIKELMERFPEVEFKGFCFVKDIELIQKMNFKNKFSYFVINNIIDIVEKSTVFFANRQKDNRILLFLMKNVPMVLPIVFLNERLSMTVDELGTTESHKNLLQYLKKWGISDTQIEKESQNFFLLFYNHLIPNYLNIDLSIEGNLLFKELLILGIKLGLSNPEYRKLIYQFSQLWIK